MRTSDRGGLESAVCPLQCTRERETWCTPRSSVCSWDRKGPVSPGEDSGCGLCCFIQHVLGAEHRGTYTESINKQGM